jgi:hypothetical protein
VEGEPVKGKAVKPLKPTKAAALQLLQQLAREHGHYTIQAAAVEMPVQSSQPMQPGAADQMSTPALQAQLPQPAATDSTPISAESDAEAEVTPSGGIAAAEEDDRQAPCSPSEPVLGGVLVSLGSRQATDSLPETAQPLQQEAAPATACINLEVDLQEARGTSEQCQSDYRSSTRPSLATIIQQQRRQLSRSSWQPQSEPEVVLALTEAQQQQLQQDKNTAAESWDAAKPVTAHLHSGILTNAEQELAQSTDNGMSISARAPSTSGSLVQSHCEQSGLEIAADKDSSHGLLWQRLAECLQEKQAAQKLAGLTVTLLARM